MTESRIATHDLVERRKSDAPLDDIDRSYAASLADAVANCRVTCKHEPSAFDLEQQGYDTIVRALRFFAQSATLPPIASPSMLASYCMNKGHREEKSEWQIAWELLRDAKAISIPSATASPDAEDAARYRYLRERGAALAGSYHQREGLVRRFGNLDEEVDREMRLSDRYTDNAQEDRPGQTPSGGSSQSGGQPVIGAPSSTRSEKP